MYLVYIFHLVLFIIIFANKIKAAPPSAAVKTVQGDNCNSSIHKSKERAKQAWWMRIFVLWKQFEDTVLVFPKLDILLLTGSNAALNTTLSGMN